VSFGIDDVLVRDVEQSLRGQGFTLTPLKCDRSSEGASYGNAVYILKLPGKQAQGLWMLWNCAHDGCTGSFAILYRRSDVSRVECAGA
jgi:hypothetical protein